ncbi:hypothetical protein, partial [Ralstonia pseudosolanacearum]
MLVYANSFAFEANTGTEQIVQLIAKWVGQRSKAYVDPVRLAGGIRELHLKDGSTLSSLVTADDYGKTLHPFLFCARLSHGDDQVPGRRWTTEIGLRKENENAVVECTIVLKTDEVSARVNAPIQVTRPKLVQLLVENFRPIGHTAGLSVKQLTMDSAPAFLHEVERRERRHPLVIVSLGRDGTFSVMPERLRTIVIGLADVVEIPANVDTFELQGAIGRRYIAFGGAINIVFPVRRACHEPICDTVLLRPENFDFIRNIESEVLSVITHRTNSPYSWKHISTESVNQAILRNKLLRVVAQAKEKNDTASEISEYIALLEEADRELQAKDSEMDQLRTSLENESEETRRLEANIASLKHALSGRDSADDPNSEEMADALISLRQAIVALQKGDISLEETLEIVATLYPDRIVALDSAYDSARTSDKGGFRYGIKAFELLSKLASEYWQILADGKGDQQAKSVFGQNAYAANEARETLINGVREWNREPSCSRFPHRGKEVPIEHVFRR